MVAAQPARCDRADIDRGDVGRADAAILVDPDRGDTSGPEVIARETFAAHPGHLCDGSRWLPRLSSIVPAR